MADDKILDRVRKLLDQANHPNTGEAEREAFLSKANSMMFKHAIDEALLDARKTGTERTPTSRRFHAYDRAGNYEWVSKFQTILYVMQEVTRCRAALYHNGDVTVVGMSDDVEYFELLWTNIYFGFINRLNPRWDNNLPMEANVYNFKKAGWKWINIREEAVKNSCWIEWPDGGVLIRAYKKHAKAIGDTEVIKTQRFAAYRESFAEGFTRSVCRRMEIQHEENDDTARQTGSGAELVLVNVKDRVDEAFYGEFPAFRPATPEDLEQMRLERKEREEREAAEEQAKIDAMTDDQRLRYFDKKEQERQAEVRRNERYWRQADKENAARFDSSGLSAGRRAGEQVDLGGRGRVGDSKPKGEI